VTAAPLRRANDKRKGLFLLSFLYLSFLFRETAPPPPPLHRSVTFFFCAFYWTTVVVLERNVFLNGPFSFRFVVVRRGRRSFREE